MYAWTRARKYAHTLALGRTNAHAHTHTRARAAKSELIVTSVRLAYNVSAVKEERKKNSAQRKGQGIEGCEGREEGSMLLLCC